MDVPSSAGPRAREAPELTTMRGLFLLRPDAPSSHVAALPRQEALPVGAGSSHRLKSPKGLEIARRSCRADVVYSAPMPVSILRLLSLAAVLGVALPAAHAKPSVAVLGLEVVEEGGIDAKTTGAARNLTRELRAEAARGEGRFTLAADAAKDLLELKLLSDCSDEGRRCMAEIGKELKADFLIYGKIERAKNGYQVALKLLDTATAQMIKTTSDIVPFDDAAGPQAATWAASFYGRLTGVPDTGTLVVSGDVVGTVYVDGERKAPLIGGIARISGIAPGPHRVTIEEEGGARRDAEIEIAAGQEAQLTVELDRGPARDDEDEAGERPGGGWRTAFWVATGAATASAMAWTVEAHRYAGLWITDGPAKRKQLRAVDRLNALLPADDRLAPSDDACGIARDRYVGSSDRDIAERAGEVDSTCGNGEFHANMTLAFGIATGVSAAAAAYFYYKGYVRPGAAGASERRAGRRARRDPIVRVVPAVSPTTVGAGLAIEF